MAKTASIEYPTNEGCIFCKIVAGEIPCHKLYEGERVLAFLDVNPLAKGHALVIPKGHYEELQEMPLGDVAACGMAVARIGKAIKEVTGCEGYNVLQNNGAVAGQAVFHVHFHIIPRFKEDGLGYRWNAGDLDKEGLESFMEAVTSKL